MLDRAEQRSKQLGMVQAQKTPLTEHNQEPANQPPAISTSGGVNAVVKRQNTRRKSASSPQKHQKSTLTLTRNMGTPSKRQPPNEQEIDGEASKENLDVALEINITAGHNVQVTFYLLNKWLNMFLLLKYFQQSKSGFFEVSAWVRFYF